MLCIRTKCFVSSIRSLTKTLTTKISPIYSISMITLHMLYMSVVIPFLMIIVLYVKTMMRIFRQFRMLQMTLFKHLRQNYLVSTSVLFNRGEPERTPQTVLSVCAMHTFNVQSCIYSTAIR